MTLINKIRRYTKSYITSLMLKKNHHCHMPTKNENEFLQIPTSCICCSFRNIQHFSIFKSDEYTRRK